MKPMTEFGRGCRGVLVLLATLVSLGASAADSCNLVIPEIPGSSEKRGREGSIDVFAVDHELTQPLDLGTGAATGVRQHRPLTVLKQIDRATPLLHKAVATGRVLKRVTLDFYRLDPATRQEQKYYQVRLDGVRIVGVKTLVPTTFLPENAAYGHMEEVRLVYEAIEWNWLPDAVVEQDTWRGGRGAGLTEPGAARSGSTSEGR